MADGLQLIYTDNPGALPTSFALPAGLDFLLEAVTADIDGAAAGGTFVPCLAAYSQDGKLIARVPSSQTFNPGDSGVVTWAPFLNRGGSSATPGQVFVGARIENQGGQSVPNATNTDRHFDAVIFDTDNMVDLGANDRIITINTAGIYLIVTEANFAVNANARRICQIYVNGYYSAGTGLGVGNFSIQAVTDANARTAVPAVALYQFSAGDFVSGGVYQQSGGALTEGGAGAAHTSFLSVARIGT